MAKPPTFIPPPGYVKETPEQRRERFVMEKGQYTLHHPDGTPITPEELAARPSRPWGALQERPGKAK